MDCYILKYSKKGAERLILTKHGYIIKWWERNSGMERGSPPSRRVTEETNIKNRESIGIQLGEFLLWWFDWAEENLQKSSVKRCQQKKR